MFICKFDKPTIKQNSTASRSCSNLQSFAPVTQQKEILFQKWAFGEKGYDAPNLCKAWNERHGFTYPLYPDAIVSGDLEIMQRLYEQCFKKCAKPAVNGAVKENTLHPNNQTLNTKDKAVDKKMHKVTESMKKAEKDIKKHMPVKAEKVLKRAEKANEKLVKIDKNVRDPIIEKAKKAGIKAPKKMGK